MSKKKLFIGCCAGIALCGAIWLGSRALQKEPEFPTYVDPITTPIVIQEETTPLVPTPKVTTKTTKQKTTKKVKLKKASKKSYTKKLPTKTTKTTNTVTSGNTQTTVDTKKVTVTTEKYIKKKKYKKVTKTVTTTITTTIVTMQNNAQKVAGTDSETVDTAEVIVEKYQVDAASIAPKMDNRVISAFSTLGFKIYIDPSVTNYSGYFNAKNQSITLREEGSVVYHELGHFLAFIANNYDRSSAFAKVYSAEKGLYTGVNQIYVTQNASEYFAESVKDYILDPATLKAKRPETYNAVETAFNTITDTQIARIQKIYGAFWK